MTRSITKSKIRVVAADDHAAFLEGLAKLLALDGEFQVVALAADGAEAVDACKRHRPDVLVLDWRMPGLDGAGALRRLARFAAPPRVVVLTASDDDRDHVRALASGAHGVALKSECSDRLAEAIRAAYRGEIWLAEDALPLPEAPESASL